MNLTDRLAVSLAAAINSEAEKIAWRKKYKFKREEPDWFQGAAEALELYNEEREQQILDKSRIY